MYNSIEKHDTARGKKISNSFLSLRPFVSSVSTRTTHASRMMQETGRNRRKPLQTKTCTNTQRHGDIAHEQLTRTWNIGSIAVSCSIGENQIEKLLTNSLPRRSDSCGVTNESGSSCTHLPPNCHMALKTVPTFLFVPRVRRYHMALLRHPLLILLSSSGVATQRLSGGRYAVKWNELSPGRIRYRFGKFILLKHKV